MLSMGLNLSFLNFASLCWDCLCPIDPVCQGSKARLSHYGSQGDFYLGQSSTCLRSDALSLASYPGTFSLSTRRGQVWGRCPAGYFCTPGTSEITSDSGKPQALCTQKQLCAEQCPSGNGPCRQPAGRKGSGSTQLSLYHVCAWMYI